MKEHNLSSTIRKKNPYKNIRKIQQDNKVHSNLLDRKFNPELPNKVYSTDITYLPYGKNKSKLAYLSATKDLGSKEIVYFNVSEKIDLNLGHKRKKLLLTSSQIHSIID